MIASVVMVALISLKRLFVAASMKNVSRFPDVRRKQVACSTPLAVGSG